MSNGACVASSSCSAGQYWDGAQCADNQCECTNGTPKTGVDCPSNGFALCDYCDDEHYRVVLGACGRNNNWAKEINPVFGTGLSDCNLGWSSKSTNGTTCVSPCNTTAYVDSQTLLCTAYTTCTAGQYETHSPTETADRQCADNQCACSNGVPATGVDCPNHGAPKCTECSTGYYLNGDDECQLSPCTLGQYNDGDGCQYCPVGQTTTDGTATSAADCASPFIPSTYQFTEFGSYPGEISFNIAEPNGNVIITGTVVGGKQPLNITAQEIYTLNMIDSYGDGWNGANLRIINNGNTNDFTLSSGSSSTAEIELYPSPEETPCSLGNYGYGTCTPCPEGKTTSIDGALFAYDCVQCPAGQSLVGRNCESVVLGSKEELQTAISDCQTTGWGIGRCIPNYWDVSQVTDMSGIFFNDNMFNEDISQWDVSNVENMERMFYMAKAFNQSISGWNVSKVENMMYMFMSAEAFNQDISGWDVSSVTNMYGTFMSAKAFNQDISGWDVSSVTNMLLMFYNALVFNQDISGWDVSKVENMASMFSRAEVFNQDISGWNVSKVVSMGSMFREAKAFNQDISGWDVSSVNYMAFMFNGAKVFNQQLCWNLMAVVDTKDMFLYSQTSFDLQKIYYDDGLCTIDNNGCRGTMYHDGSKCVFVTDFTKKIKSDKSGLEDCPTGEVSAPFGLICRTETTCPVGQYYENGNCQKCPVGLTTRHVYATIPEECIPPLDKEPCSPGNYGIETCTSCPENKTALLGALFEYDCMECPLELVLSTDRECVNRRFGADTYDLHNAIQYCKNDWNTYGCIPNAWDVSQVTNMENAFYGLGTFNEDISAWDTSSVTSMNAMFQGANAFNQDISGWNVSKVKKMDLMFFDAEAFNQNINIWDVSSVTTMYEMFSGASNFNQPLHLWNVSSVFYMSKMFYDSGFNHTLSCWNFGANPSGTNPSITDILHNSPARDLTHYIKTQSFNPNAAYIPNQGDKDDENSDCAPCATGFTRGPDSMDCISSCPAGEDESTGSCQPCAAGKYRASNMPICRNCTDGWTSPPGSDECYTFYDLPDQALIDEWQRRHGTCGN